MTRANVNKTINASAEAVWQQLGQFDGLKAGGTITSIDYEGQGVGMLRTINMENGAVVERLEQHDSASRSFTYAIINDDSPLPFSNYSASVSIAENSDGTCTVDWTGTFEPKGIPEEQAIGIATGIYAGAIKGAKVALGVA